MVPSPVTLPMTQSFTLHSQHTGRDYLIEVALPKAGAPRAGYPVLYALDGNARLPLLREARETLTRGGPRGDGLPLIVVGIGYPGIDRFAITARAEDYIPPGRDSADMSDDTPHGGADRFLAFIETELKPALASRYALDRSRQSLFGHSYGGLFTLYVLLTCPECFRDYIAISPSLWWHRERFFDDAVAAFADPGLCRKLKDRRVLMGVGALEQTPMPEERGTPKGERRRHNAMVDNARGMAEWLQRECLMLETRFTEFANTDHGSVMWPAARWIMEAFED